jgi:hypothetical protein
MITDYNLRPLLHQERTVAYREIMAKPFPPPGAKPGKSKAEKKAFWAQYRSRDEAHFLPILEESIEEQFKGCKPTPTAPAGMPASAPTFGRKTRMKNPSNPMEFPGSFPPPTWKNQLAAAKELPTSELRRHASVSYGNRHRCKDCFTCAAATVLEEREGGREGNPPMLIIGNPPSRAEKKLDKEIEAAYYRHGYGVQVDIMDIGKIFRDAKLEMAAGVPLDTAMQGIIARYRKNPGTRCKPPKIMDPISEKCVQPMFGRRGNPRHQQFEGAPEPAREVGAAHGAAFAKTAQAQRLIQASGMDPFTWAREYAGEYAASKGIGFPDEEYAYEYIKGFGGAFHRDENPHTGTRAALEATAARAGLSMDTWSPGDGVTRYRFFPFPSGDYFAHSHQAIGTALGLKNAFKLVEDYAERGDYPRKRNPLTPSEMTELSKLEDSARHHEEFARRNGDRDGQMFSQGQQAGYRFVEGKFGPTRGKLGPDHPGKRRKNPTDPTGKDFPAGFIFWEAEGQDAQNEAYNALRILHENNIPANLEVVPGDPRKFGAWRYRIHVSPPGDSIERMIYDGVLNRIASEAMQGQMTGHWPSLTRVPRSQRKSPPRKVGILHKMVQEKKEREARGENCCNPESRTGNPPRFIVLDAQTGVVQYTKVATKTGDEALRKAHERAQDMANKLGRVFLVFLDLHNTKVGAQLNVPMVMTLGATEVHPGAGRGENPSHGLPAHIANDPAFQKELKAYRRRHGSGPVEVRTVQVPKGYPKFMSVYGEAPHAVYDAPSHSIKGKRIHHFGKKGSGKPWLVSSASRGPKFLAYVGGKFRAGTDWLYD